MKSLINKPIQSALITCVLSCSAISAGPAFATIAIADRPLFLGIDADPNIMFILDDSGSMHFEFMPSSLADSLWFNPYTTPQPGGVYGGGDYRLSNCGGDRNYAVPTFEDSNAFNLVLRSPQFNGVYYNPDITYQPWYNADGTLMPDANPRSALFNPTNAGLGGLDLLASQTVQAFWFNGADADGAQNWTGGGCGGWNHTYSPITYYLYDGDGSKNLIGNYQKVQITSTTPAGNVYTSPAGIKRTRDEEIQNFANWFSYYRSRVLAARSGIGAAFSSQGEDLRVGYGTINKGSSTVDGVSSGTIINGVRAFSGADRTSFYDLLYNRTIPNSGTPLRKALDDVGQYYSRADNPGPWGEIPGTNSSTAHVECRRSYTVLMTDGYWNGAEASTSGARNNNDNTSSSSAHSNPDSDNYLQRRDGSNYDRYLREDPFKDEYSNTLADIAMYYWKNDLRTNLANKVPVMPEAEGIQDIANPAYWQHMITFGVGLGVSGTIEVNEAYKAVKEGTAIDWVEPTSEGPEKLDDLLHASINSRGGFFSAADPNTFANELKNILDQISSDESSSSSAVANTTRLDTDTLVYQAKFSPDNWSGQLLAFDIETDGSVDTDNPIWDADDKLPSAGQRNILTFRPGTGAQAGGIEFQWNNLSNTQQTALNADIFGAADGQGQDRLTWLRGDTTVTGPAANPFRSRVSESLDDNDGFDILGDIVNSDPIFVGSGDFGYGRDTSGLSDQEKSDYNAFRADSSFQNRRGMIYIGANDGMLHGFDAITGRERIAYVPNAVFPKLSALTSTSYTHQYYVDATPHMGDAYINGSWRTMLVSTLGAGGRAIFALDITQPSSINASDVMWEVEADSGDADLRHMGNMLGKPQLVRTQSSNDDWVVLVGNGYNSDDHQAVLFVLDAEDGSVITTINTGVGSAAEPNGLGTPLAVDLDGDRILDAVYAGDLHGNLWKFDFSSSNSSRWDVAIKSGSTPEPLFQACEGTGACNATTRQPITVQPTIASLENGVVVLFGTGRYFADGDSQVSSNPRTESLYGIFDCGVTNNNQLCGSTVAKNELIAQPILLEDNRGTPSVLDDDIRVGADNPVTFTQRIKGWYMDLITPGASDGAGERVVANPVLINDAVAFVTFIPDSNPCNFGGSSWLMEMNPKTGGRFPAPKLDANNDGVIDENDVVIVNGQPVPITGKRSDEKQSSPGVLHGGGEDGKTIFKIFSGSSGNIDVEMNTGVNKAGRQSWYELR